VRADTPTGNVEIEWQFDAIDLRPVQRWLMNVAGRTLANGGGTAGVVAVRSKPTKRLVDSYLDTEDWRIGRSGFVLRTRKSGGLGEVTLKDTTPAKGGLRKRVEITEQLPPGGTDELGDEGPVGRRLRALAGNRPLRTVLEVRTTRRPYDVLVGEETAGEVALDETSTSVGGGERPTRLRRVEVEVSRDWARATHDLVGDLRATCALQPATLSKFEAGLLAAGVSVPGTPDLGPTQVSPGSSVGELAYAVLRRNLTSMLVHEPGTRLGEDPEELHDMRVATRRLRAGMSLFENALPVRARHLRDELGWLGRELGAVRDLDVQLERITEWTKEVPPDDRSALDGLARLLEKERGDARAQFLSSVESARYERLVSGLSTVFRQGPSRRSAAARAPAAAVVPDLVSARQRAAAKAARRARRSGRPDDFHRLRIRCKRLRYALEFVSDIYPGATQKMVRRVTRLQDLLGLMQDAIVASTRLHALATTEDSPLSASTVFVMGGLAERHRNEAQQISKTLPKKLRGLDGGVWQRFRLVMDRRRPEFGALYRWAPGPAASDRDGTGTAGDGAGGHLS
jgi:CHAD domain-containing protein